MYIHNAYLTSFSERYKVTLSIPFPFGVRWWVDREGEAFKMPFYTEIQSGSFGFPAIVAVGNAKLWRELGASSHVGLSHNFTQETNVFWFLLSQPGLKNLTFFFSPSGG